MAVEATQAHWKKTIWYVVLTLLAIVVLFPIYMTLVRALSTPAVYVREGLPLYPVSIEWDVWSRAWDLGNLDEKIAVSAVVTVIIVCGQLITSTLAAYAFAFLEFPLKRVLFLVFMATLMLPIEVTLIPNVQTIRELGWFNSYQGLSVLFLATAFGTFLIRQGFMGVPRDLRDASQLDGYGHLAFLWRVAIPVTRPVIASFAVIAFLVGVEPVHLASCGGHRGSLGDDPDRAQVAVRSHRRAEQHGARGGHHRRPSRARTADLPATPTHPRPHGRCRQGLSNHESIPLHEGVIHASRQVRRRRRWLLALLLTFALIAAASRRQQRQQHRRHERRRRRIGLRREHARRARSTPSTPSPAPSRSWCGTATSPRPRRRSTSWSAQYNASRPRCSRAASRARATSYDEIWNKYQSARADRRPARASPSSRTPRPQGDRRQRHGAARAVVHRRRRLRHQRPGQPVPSTTTASIDGAFVPGHRSACRARCSTTTTNHFRPAGLDPDDLADDARRAARDGAERSRTRASRRQPLVIYLQLVVHRDVAHR